MSGGTRGRQGRAREQRLYLGGEWVEPEGGYYEVVNPADESVVGLAPEASRAQVEAAARAAAEAFGTWSRTRPEERAAILDRAADVIQREFEPLAELARAETGAPTGIARGMQVGVGVSRFRRYARGALEPVERGLPPQVTEAGPMGAASVLGALEVRQPVGVVTCITSYNNPWANPAGKVARRWPWATRWWSSRPRRTRSRCSGWPRRWRRQGFRRGW